MKSFFYRLPLREQTKKNNYRFVFSNRLLSKSIFHHIIAPMSLRLNIFMKMAFWYNFVLQNIKYCISYNRRRYWRKRWGLGGHAWKAQKNVIADFCSHILSYSNPDCATKRRRAKAIHVEGGSLMEVPSYCLILRFLKFFAHHYTYLEVWTASELDKQRRENRSYHL